MTPPKNIYFIRPAGRQGPIKIGCSLLPQQRLSDLSHWSPYPLEIEAMAPGDPKLEAFVHRMFRRERSHKEWFQPSPKLLAAIEQVKAGVDIATAFGAVRKLRRNGQFYYTPVERAERSQ